MPVPAPLIDSRTYEDLVTRLEELLAQYTTWEPGKDARDPGKALVHIFTRFADLIIKRLNQVPDKNFLAFLNLLGLEIAPPQPARVPLTFQLTTGSTADGLVAANTSVAAAPFEGETESVIFETERDLVVTRSGTAFAYAREPAMDRYSDHSAVATGQAEGAFEIFHGNRPIKRRIYLGHSALYGLEGSKDITLQFTPADPNHPWLHIVEWAYWDGTGWKPLLPETPAAGHANSWSLTFKGAPQIQEHSVSDKKCAWLRGTLTTPLPVGELVELDKAAARRQLSQSNLFPDVILSDGIPLDYEKTMYPFGKETPKTHFYLACDMAFSKPGAKTTIDMQLEDDADVQPSQDLRLSWQYWDGGNWQELGRSSPLDPSITQSGFGFVDDTGAFSRDGTVHFTCPENWKETEINALQKRWLRVRVESGGYGSASDFRPPAVAHLLLGYEWPLPRVDTIRTFVDIQRSEWPFDLSFTNHLPVDQTIDFFPFGEKPKVGDTLYLASKDAFSKPGAAVELDVKLTNESDSAATPPPAGASSDLVLDWEFWDRKIQKWATLGRSRAGVSEDAGNAFKDDTDRFTREGKVSFTCPDLMGTVQVNGETRHWLRVRITSGNYGIEARYDSMKDANGKEVINPDTQMPIYILEPATFAPPSIKSMEISYSYNSSEQPLEYTLIENDFRIQNVSADAVKQGVLFSPFVTPLDDRPTFYLGFVRPDSDTGFANRTTTLYFRVPEILYQRAIGGQRVEEGPPVVTWEYWNGHQWTRLGVRDETLNLSRRGLLTFVGPSDFQASREFFQDAFWLRAIWELGAYTVSPRLKRVLTNTMWAVNAQSIKKEILGSSSNEPGQTFRLSKVPVLSGQRIEIREPEMPPAHEIKMIEKEEGKDAITVARDTVGNPKEIWVRWHPVNVFYASGPRSRHYTMDRMTGELRFGDGQYGMVPPQGRSNIRARRYQTGGGPQGNRPAGNITQLKSTVPYIDNVANHEPAASGASQGSLEDVRAQGPKTLRHRFRAVTVSDFEDLAFEASPRVLRAKCVQAQSAADAGSVGLIIVPESSEKQPIPSLELLGRVKEYIGKRLAPTVNLWVNGPDWLQVTVKVNVVPVNPEQTADVKTAVLERLEKFLHPLTGGLEGKGWAFGRKPYRSDLLALLEGTPGVDHLRSLSVTEEGEVRPGRFLVFSGDHEITMTGLLD